jgi:hypothetical protein
MFNYIPINIAYPWVKNDDGDVCLLFVALLTQSKDGYFIRPNKFLQQSFIKQPLYYRCGKR